MCSKLLFLLLTVSFVSFSSSQKDRKFFRKGYFYLEATQSFYKFHALQRTWKDAKRMCALEGAQFFYPQDNKEAQVVLAVWRETQPLNEVLVGISDLVAKGVFVTIDGKSVEDVYQNWGPGEPNDEFDNEDCVVLRKDGTYNDVPCLNKHPFICKKPIETLEWNQECNMPNLDYKFNEKLGSCYKFHLKPLTWPDAYAVCTAEQSYLAVINSQQEADHLVALTESARLANVTGIVHLGYHDRNDEGWETVRGTPLTDSGYTTWGYGQPDGSARGVDERCGSMFYNGELNDIRCEREQLFICEHEIDKLS